MAVAITFILFSQAMSSIVISVKNLFKKYETVQAVNDISFEVYEKEIFGLLGPNGAGKTTTLEIIETLREKTSGEVLVDGLNIETHANDIKKIIGVQLQAAGYYPNLTLAELVELFAGLYNKEVDALEVLKSVKAAMESTGIVDLKFRIPYRLKTDKNSYTIHYRWESKDKSRNMDLDRRAHV